MRKILLIIISIVCCNIANAQPTLTFLSHDTLTPNNEDTIGVFCRVFHHPGRNKFYSVYAGRVAGSTDPEGQMGYFTWREYDTNFVFTGNHDTLDNQLSPGDFAMLQVGTDYYHLTVGPMHSYKLTKYDEDFNWVNDTLIPLDSNDSNTDQLMNYTNGRLVIGAFHEDSEIYPSFPMQTSWTPVMHKFEFDLNLNSVTPETHLNEHYYSWGGSVIHNSTNNTYSIVTMDSMLMYNLHAYHYDNNWNYLGKTLLNTDGQWSQGIIWDGTYYYVSYHTGNEHRAGNITISIYDINWNEVYTTTITSHVTFPMPNGTADTSAQRPVLTKVGNKLYVSYDEESYQFISGGFFDLHSDWQSHVQVFRIDGLSSVENYEQNTFQVFPNPAQTQVNIYYDHVESSVLNFTNVTGQLVKTCMLTEGTNILNINDLSPGLYFIHYSFNNQTYSSKIIKN